MRSWLLAPMLALLAGHLPAADTEFSLTESRPIFIAPPGAASGALIQATIEPTRHELRFDDVLAAERWEQNFQLAAPLAITEAFSLRQELRTGLQNETVRLDEFSTAARDAIAVLEKTSAELRASEALRLAASVQDQWLANNSVPFAEIVTYGAEAKFSPVKTTAVKLQIELQERDEFAAAQSEQTTWRLALEQELVPKRLKAVAGASLIRAGELDSADRGSSTGKVDGSVQWSPLTDTAFTLGAGRTHRETAALCEDVDAYAFKVQQQIFSRSRLEMQAGYELRTRGPLDLPESDGWNLGASSDFALRDDWNAGVGVRYRLRDEPLTANPLDDLSLTLSLKGRF